MSKVAKAAANRKKRQDKLRERGSRFQKSGIFVKFTTLPLVRGLFDINLGEWKDAIRLYNERYHPDIEIDEYGKMIIERYVEDDDELPDIMFAGEESRAVLLQKARDEKNMAVILRVVDEFVPTVDLLLLFGYLDIMYWKKNESRTLNMLMQYY